MKKEPIFIVGVPRSGTTLLRMMLNSHSKIAIAPETHFFRFFWANRDKYGDLKKEENFKKLWNDLVRCKYFQDLKLKDTQKIYRSLLNHEQRDYKNIFEKLCKEYAKQNNKLRWGEKTPGHLEYLEIILSFFPSAKIIHIIRDPRDVALSYKKVPWGVNDVFSVARLWNRYMNIFKNFKNKNKSNFLEVKYEDLVIKAKDILQTICAFIGEEFEEQMLSFHFYSKQYIEHNEPWKEGVLKPLTVSNVGKYKKGLSKWEIEQIETKCWKHMLDKDYTLLFLNPFSYFDLTIKNILFHNLWFFKAVFHRIKNLKKGGKE